MKIKGDFVTNSSSTSFVLRFDCYLKEKTVKKEIDCKKSLESVFELYCNNPQSHIDHYSSDQSASLMGVYIHDEDKEENTESQGIIDIELINGAKYTTKSDKLQKTILLNLAAKSLLLNEKPYPGDLYTNRLIKILDETLRDVVGNIEVMFHQYPSEVLGDGWDTGDPMGQYTTKYELFKNETKLGRITRVKNLWKLEIKK